MSDQVCSDRHLLVFKINSLVTGGCDFSFVTVQNGALMTLLLYLDPPVLISCVINLNFVIVFD